MSEQAKAKISIARKGINISVETKAKLSSLMTVRRGVAVEVTNLISGEIKQYASLTLASVAMDVSRTAVKKANRVELLKVLTLLS